VKDVKAERTGRYKGTEVEMNAEQNNKNVLFWDVAP
jgi:hypothetical protein